MASAATPSGSSGTITRWSASGGNGSGGADGTASCPGRASAPCSRDTLSHAPGSSTSTPRRERSSGARNRMREIRSSGSVRGGVGNDPAYSAERELDLTRRPVLEQALEAGVAVHLQHALKLGQVGCRVLALAVLGIE